MSYKRFTCTVAAASVETARAALEAAGFGPGNLIVPLVPASSAVGATPTVYGTDCCLTPEQYADWQAALRTAGVEFTSVLRDNPDPVTGRPSFDVAIARRLTLTRGGGAVPRPRGGLP